MADDDLTDAEKAYLESGGENADGLLAENNAAAGDSAADTKVSDAPADKMAAADKGADKPAAQVADADDDDEDAPKDPKATVPYQKFARERKKLREKLAAAEKSGSERTAALEKQLSELNEKYARGDERLRLLAEAMQPQQQEQTEEDPEPDPNEDIIGWAQWSRRENARLRQQMTGIQEANQQTRTTLDSTNAENQTRQQYQSDVVAFARETPDFMQGYNHLFNARGQMLLDQGYSEAEARQIIFNEEKTLVQQAIARGQRPAQLIYNMAKRMGYQPPAANGQQQNGAANGEAKNGQNGAQNGSAPARNASVVEEIERIQRGQDASKSLSGTGGGASELTVEALANMSEAEFSALYAKQKGQIDNLLGKRH